jgi:hypothetical protein
MFSLPNLNGKSENPPPLFDVFAGGFMREKKLEIYSSISF